MKKISSLLGVLLGFAAILLAQMLDHGSPKSLINPSALTLIFLGTTGATLAATSLGDLTSVPKMAIYALLKAEVPDFGKLVADMDSWAKIAKKEGILKLDRLTSEITDYFLRESLQNVVDGTRIEDLKVLLEERNKALFGRDISAADFFEKAGGFSPTLGIIGTVVGLISVLSNIANVEALAGSIATAFTATLWGVMLANIFWLPVAMRLSKVAGEHRFYRSVATAGFLMLSEGSTAKDIRDRMGALLAGRDLGKGGKGKGKGASAGETGGEALAAAGGAGA